MTRNTEPLLTLQDLATEWQVSVKSIRRMVARGDLTVVRIGSLLRITSAEKAAYERRRRT